MSSENDLLHQPDTLQPPRSFKLLKPLALLATVLLIALVIGTGGYLLGIRANQNASQSTQRVSFQLSPIITEQLLISPSTISPTKSPLLLISPTPIGTSDLSASWHTYTSVRYGFSFQYPTIWTLNDSGSKIDVQKGSTILTFYLYNDPDAGFSAYPKALGQETINIGNQVAIFNYYTASVVSEPSAYSDVRALPTIGKYIKTINFYLDKKSSMNDLLSIKKILATFKFLEQPTPQ